MDIKNIDTVALGLKIAKARKDAGLSVEDIAGKLNLGVFIYSLYESGKLEAEQSVLNDIAALCGIDVSEFDL